MAPCLGICHLLHQSVKTSPFCADNAVGSRRRAKISWMVLMALPQAVRCPGDAIQQMKWLISAVQFDWSTCFLEVLLTHDITTTPMPTPMSGLHQFHHRPVPNQCQRVRRSYAAHSLCLQRACSPAADTVAMQYENCMK